jgi:acyl-CoA dehydrogenase
VEITPSTRELSFIPEVPHSAVKFTNCVIPSANVLPGDGYRDYVKHFRTIEDIHVEAALIAYAFRLARQYLIEKELCARLLTLLAALLEASREQPSDPAVHILLSGIFAESSAALTELEAELPRAGATSDVMANWERDKPLRSVARRARDARLRVAWDTVRSPRSAL